MDTSEYYGGLYPDPPEEIEEEEYIYDEDYYYEEMINEINYYLKNYKDKFEEGSNNE